MEVREPLSKVLGFDARKTAEIEVDICKLLFVDKPDTKAFVKILKKYEGDDLIFASYFSGFIGGIACAFADPISTREAYKDFANLGELADANREYAIQKRIRQWEELEKAELKKVERRDIV